MGRAFLSPSTPTYATRCSRAHTTSHEGTQKTLQWLRGDFFIPGDHTLVRDYGTCQHNKTKSLQPVGLLKPLEVWADISMDFIQASSWSWIDHSGSGP